MTVTSGDANARHLRLDELEQGQSWSETWAITNAEVDAFVELVEDRAPAHIESAHAQALGFPGIVVHGMLVAARYSRLLGMFLPGADTVLHSVELRMEAPVHLGDTLTYSVTVGRVINAVRSVRLDLEARNQHGDVVSRGGATCVFRG